MAQEVIEVLQPIRERYHQLINEPAYLEGVLEAGALRAESHAQETWYEVSRKIGIVNNYLNSAELAINNQN